MCLTSLKLSLFQQLQRIFPAQLRSLCYPFAPTFTRYNVQKGNDKKRENTQKISAQNLCQASENGKTQKSLGENTVALKIKWKWIARLNFNGASGTLMFTQVEIESLAARLVTGCPHSPSPLCLNIIRCPFPAGNFLHNHKSKVDYRKKATRSRQGNAKNIMKNICAKTVRKTQK